MLGAQGASGGLLQGEDEERILPVDEAFPFDHLYDRDQLIFRWQTVEGHYLYRHRFALHGASGETISLQLPEGKLEKDPYFGDVYISSKIRSKSQSTSISRWLTAKRVRASE